MCLFKTDFPASVHHLIEVSAGKEVLFVFDFSLSSEFTQLDFYSGTVSTHIDECYLLMTSTSKILIADILQFEIVDCSEMIQ